jgi:menaquinone-dependent protoporphyrinogen oxidase
MPQKVLVAYATKKGSTQEVAEAISDELRDRGFAVTTLAASAVRDVEPYDGVVLGGSLYMGRWHPDARRLLERYADKLATRLLAVFAIGPLTSGVDDLASARRQLDHALDKIAEAQPVTVAVFGGVVKPENLHFPFSRMPATDARDWDQIRSWARTVTAMFAAARTRTAS